MLNSCTWLLTQALDSPNWEQSWHIVTSEYVDSICCRARGGGGGWGWGMNKWDFECPVWSYLYCDSWPLFCPCLGPPLSMTDSILSFVVHHWSHCACKLLQEVSLLSPPKWLNPPTLFSKIYQQQLLSVPYPFSWPLIPIRTYFLLTVKSYISFPEDIFFPLEGILLQ